MAGVSGKGYEHAQSIFDELGYGNPRPRRTGYSTNFNELMAALNIAGIECRRYRWRDWDSLPALSILKVEAWMPNPKPTYWHWVIAARHESFGIAVVDGNCPLSCIENAPADRWHVPRNVYKPFGSFIEIQSGSPFLRVC
jgi:hypothetical protein